ncbi:MAG: trypsin-like peptidase domain-containing protein [Pirellulales bacterium]|nr:trypsin-like peptidase domain-containing protein [Pirellulales bacterium]
MRENHIACPACYAPLKFVGERTSLVCRHCGHQFEVAAPASASDVPAPAPRRPRRPPVELVDLAEESPSGGIQNVVVGAAVGVIVAVLVVAAAIALKSDSAPAEARVEPAATDVEPPHVVGWLSNKVPLIVLAKPEARSPVTHEAPPPSSADSSAEPATVAASPEESPGVVPPLRSGALPPVVAQVEESPSGPAATAPSLPTDPGPPSTDSPRLASSRPWRYHWRIGDVHDYEFELEAGLPEDRQEISGTWNLRVAGVHREPEPERLSAQGTAFVVAPDGYLVTCEHVVRDAARVIVHLGDRHWPAEVLAVDALQDLALVRVAADDLPVLAISSAEDVDLGAEVRVIGFPLASLFESRGIKMTTGTVTGLTETNRQGVRLFQVDASVNPGNSGGPLLNDVGEVVGVASKYLAAATLSNVGMAAPAAEVRRFLRDAGLEISASTASTKLTGTEIAKRAVPSVAYVELELDPEVARVYKIEFRADHRGTTVAPRRAPFPGWHDSARVVRTPTFRSEPGSFHVTSDGTVDEYEGGYSLPYVLDPAAAVVVESVAHGGKSKWHSVRESTFSVPRPGARIEFPSVMPHGFPAPRSFAGRTSGSLFGTDEPEADLYDALETIDYEVQSETEDEVVIARQYEFKTTDGSPPLYRQQGTGTIRFSKRRGEVVDAEHQIDLSVRGDDGVVRTVPAKLAYRLRNPTLVAAERGVRSALEAGRRLRDATTARPPQDEQPSETPLDDPRRIDQLLRSLDPRRVAREQSQVVDEFILEHAPPEFVEQVRRATSPSHADELRELGRLAVVPDRQDRVVAVLIAHARAGRPFDVEPAIQSLKRWASDKHVPDLLRLYEFMGGGMNWPEREAILEILVELNAPASIDALVGLLGDKQNGRRVVEALVKIGPPVQDAVVKALKNPHGMVRAGAADVLREMDAKEALPALRAALAEETNWQVQIRFESAIRRLERQ